MWQRVTEKFVDSGDLVVLGVALEQHPERTRLYTQWRQLDWPIVVDSLNELDLAVVPVAMGIDESGVVRHARLRPKQLASEFMNQAYPVAEIKKQDSSPLPDTQELARMAESSATAESWRVLGDAHFHEGDTSLNASVDAFRKAAGLDGRDGRNVFRLGVALRRRSESQYRQSGDAQEAVVSWGRALALNPNQYIWRRRIQQYGPRLDKPYNFYSWVEQARADIRARGETPVALLTEPRGSELAAPAKGAGSAKPSALKNPDPAGQITRDKKGLVSVETLTTPSPVKPGERVRVRFTLRLAHKPAALWNNETNDLVVSMKLPSDVELVEGSLTYPNPPQAESSETRVLEAELTVPGDSRAGRIELPAYALYAVCEKAGGVCLYLRQDFKIAVDLDPAAPTIR